MKRILFGESWNSLSYTGDVAHYLSSFDLLDGSLEGRLKAGDAQQLGGCFILLAFFQIGYDRLIRLPATFSATSPANCHP